MKNRNTITKVNLILSGMWLIASLFIIMFYESPRNVLNLITLIASFIILIMSSVAIICIVISLYAEKKRGKNKQNNTNDTKE